MDKQCHIYPDERIDRFSGLGIIQKIRGPHFSLDAILLARFATVKEGDMVADLGTGGGIIPLILASTTRTAGVVGIEIQRELADIALRNVILNQLEGKVKIVEDDLKIIPKTYTAGQYDIVVSNPPYRELGTGRVNPNPLEAVSRHEIKCNLEDVLKASSHLLKDRGRAAFVYRPERVVDLIAGCRGHNLEPERLQFVHPGIDREANLVLLEALKHGQKGLRVLKPLVVSGHKIPEMGYDQYE